MKTDIEELRCIVYSHPELLVSSREWRRLARAVLGELDAQNKSYRYIETCLCEPCALARQFRAEAETNAKRITYQFQIKTGES